MTFINPGIGDGGISDWSEDPDLKALHHTQLSIGTDDPQSLALKKQYPWIIQPLIANAPMRLISGPKMAASVTVAGGIGFISGGSDLSDLIPKMQETAQIIAATALAAIYPPGILPIGVGFLNWGADLNMALQAVSKWRPAAVWFFAPNSRQELVTWTQVLRKATEDMTQVWVQVNSVQQALQVAKDCKPDVLVVQGSDAGGHGAAKCASVLTLVPECRDALDDAGFEDLPIMAAGGIVEGRTVAAAMVAGAAGVVMGTRYLASHEAQISEGYRRAILNASDGGVNTVRTTLYDSLRGTKGWPEEYNGRGVINASYRDHQNGMSKSENKRLYKEAEKMGDQGWDLQHGRMTTYAGAGVGLVRSVQSSKDITNEVRKDAMERLNKVAKNFMTTL